MIRRLLNNLSMRKDDFLYRWQLRLSGSNIDLVEAQDPETGLVILWPINRNAVKVMKECLECTDEQGNPAKPPMKRGGYLVPREIREQIHHNHLPLIASRCFLGTIIDTP